MFNVSLGVGLLIVALSAQWIITKRLKDAKLRLLYSWIAWIGAILGGTAISTDIGGRLGITALGATVVSIVGMLFLGADLKDRRPDWPAFIIACLLPTFMRLAGGGFGSLFAALLTIPDAGVRMMAAGFGA